MLSRRDLVGKLAACSAAVFATGIARSGSASTRTDAHTSTDSARNEIAAGGAPEPIALEPIARVTESNAAAVAAPSQEPAPWQLLQPLAIGSVVSHGWRVADLSSVMDGSCVLTLQNERGRTHRVHLCRNTGKPLGLVYTDQLDLVVMNGGQGDLPTDESLAQAVAEVAHVLAANEARRAQLPVMAALLPHTERLQRFSGPEDWRLR